MEQFDLIDENDNVVGTTDKQTAHANKQPHRVAAVFVFDNVGRLYVQAHKASGGLYDHSVGGHVHKGESYAAAASREAAEELGIIQPLAYVTTVYAESTSHIHMVGLFKCITDKSWKFIPNDEVEEIIPMQLDDILNLMKIEPRKFSSDFMKTMNTYCEIESLL